MLTAIMNLLYTRDTIISHRKLYYEFFKYEFALYFLLNLRILIIPLTFIGLSIFVHTNVIISFVMLTCAVIATFICSYVLVFSRINQLKCSSYEIHTKKLQDWIVRHFVTFKSIIPKSDWRKIKKLDRSLYNELTINEHFQCCYYYSLELARILKNVHLIYGSIENPVKTSETIGNTAHALILKEGQIFDSLMVRSFSLADYKKVFNLQIYHIWDYDEFCNENFKKEIKAGFVNWCELNGVKGYKNF